MSQKEPYIPGIYNYCDRWCERCPFTARCRLYATEQAAFRDPDSRDPENAAFWQTLQGVFAHTKQMIQDMARELGIDLDVVELEVTQQDIEESERRTRQHSLVVQARTYHEMVDEWFERHESLFKQKKDELIQRFRLGLEGIDPEAEALRLSDAVEVIRWYQYQIEVKLARALSDDSEDEPALAEIAAQDADGSAKVALIAMDRSLAAWAVLREALPEQADELLGLLLHIDRLRRATERTFPNARAFIRPGFDTSGEQGALAPG